MKFRANWPFGTEEEAQNRFSRWQPLQPSLISDRNDFSYFLSTVTPILQSVFLSVKEKMFKIDFQDGGRGSYLGFLIETI